MKPVLFTITLSGKSVPVYSYVFFMAAAAIFALAAAAMIIRHYRLPFLKYMSAVLLMMVSSIIGARILYTILYLPKSIEPLEKVFALNFSGFSLHGGLAAGILTAWIIFKHDKISFLRLLDILSPVAGISAAITRVGCYLNGCCFGKVTDMHWGVKYPPFSIVYMVQYYSGKISSLQGTLPVHPTQIYEIIAAVACTITAFILLKRKSVTGYTFAVFGLTFTIGRFIIFFFRDFPGATPLSNFIRGPVTYSIAVALFIILLYSIKFKKRDAV